MHTASPGSAKLPDAALSAFHEEYRKMERALDYYDHHVDEVLRDGRLSTKSAQFLERCWRSPRPGDALSFARRDVRAALTESMIMTLLKHGQNDTSLSVGARRLRMLTTCPSSGYSDYSRGKLRLERVRNYFAKCMARRGLEGLGLIDLALVHDCRETEPSEIGIHIHAVCRPFADEADGGTLEESHEQSRRRNKHGLAVVDVSMRRAPLSWADVAGFGYYLPKVSCGLKQESSVATDTSQLRWQAHHVLRALEAYSHFSIDMAMVAVGPLGHALSEACQERLWRSLKLDQAEQAAIDHGRTARGWVRLYRDLEIDGIDSLRLV